MPAVDETFLTKLTSPSQLQCMNLRLLYSGEMPADDVDCEHGDVGKVCVDDVDGVGRVLADGVEIVG